MGSERISILASSIRSWQFMELPVQDPFWTALSGQERSRRMQEAALAVLLSIAQHRPAVLLIEDLHWIDAESEAILGHGWRRPRRARGYS